MNRTTLHATAPLLLAAAALAAPSAAQEAVAFTFDGCQGLGVWTTDGVTHPTGPLPTFGDGPDLVDSLWCSGSPFAAEPPVLTRRGGDLGGGIDYSLSGRPGEPFVLVPSFDTGPIPIGGPPTAPLVARVGLELQPLWAAGLLDPSGAAEVSIGVPNSAALLGLVLHAQFAGFSPETLGLERLSNRAALRLHEAGRSAATSSVELGRFGRHTATLLPDGRVLLTGGTNGTAAPIEGDTDRIEYFDPAKEIFYPAADRLAGPRAMHTATLLADGTVLVVGGYDDLGTPRSNVERFDPATGQSSAVQPLPAARAAHAATRLGDGRVLVAGGYQTAPTTPLQPSALSNATFLFDPQTGSWSPGPDLPEPLAECALVTLPNGDGLLYGGLTLDLLGNPESLPTTSRFELATGQFVAEPDAPAPLASSALAVLSNGKVALAGGRRIDTSGSKPSRATAIFDPTSGWSVGGDLAIARSEAQLVEVDGSLVLGGGFSNGLSVGTNEKAPLDASSWFVIGTTLVPRPGARFVAVEDGERALITGFAGGFANAAAELLRP